MRTRVTGPLRTAGTALLAVAIFAAGIILHWTGLAWPLGVLLLIGVPVWAIVTTLRS